MVFAREGRTWGFFRPHQQLTLDRGECFCDEGLSLVGLVAYFGIVAVCRGSGLAAEARNFALPAGHPDREHAEIALVLVASVALNRALPSGADGFLRRRARPGPARSTQPGRLHLPS